MTLPPPTSTTDVYLLAVVERLDAVLEALTPPADPAPTPAPSPRKRAPKRSAEEA